MKNSATNYFEALRSDYVDPKKNHYDNNRRPFNRDNSNILELMDTTAQVVTGKENRASFFEGKSLPGNTVQS